MKNLAVIYGSRSCEHEVSIISALQLIKSADPSKYNVVPVYISKSGDWYVGEKLLDMSTYIGFDPMQEGLQKVELDLHPGSGALLYTENTKGIFKKPERKLFANIDCAIPVMHGMNGEDGTLQGLLELANIPYASSRVASCAVGMDKVIMKGFFRGCGFPLIDDIWFTVDDWERDKIKCLLDIEEKLSYPVFIKPANLGSSIGVSRASNKDQLIEALQLAFHFDRKVLVEKAVKNPIELNCSVLGDMRAAIASEIEMPITGGDVLGFIEKYMAGGNRSKGMAALKRVLPAPIDDELKGKIQNMSLEIFKNLDCKGVVRIDYMLEPDTNHIYITEINVIPGSMSFYLWQESGISYQELIDRLVDIAMYAHLQKLGLNYTFASDILQSNLSGKFGAKGLKK